MPAIRSSFLLLFLVLSFDDAVTRVQARVVLRSRLKVLRRRRSWDQGFPLLSRNEAMILERRVDESKMHLLAHLRSNIRMSPKQRGRRRWGARRRSSAAVFRRGAHNLIEKPPIFPGRS